MLYKLLQDRGYKSLKHAVASNDQEGSFDAEAFSTGVAENLKLGHFRLVFVLDEAPEELIRLVNYLETISDQLVIDLITLSSSSVNDSQILVPQRVEAERQRLEPTPVTSPQPEWVKKGKKVGSLHIRKNPVCFWHNSPAIIEVCQKSTLHETHGHDARQRAQTHRISSYTQKERAWTPIQ